MIFYVPNSKHEPASTNLISKSIFSRYFAFRPTTGAFILLFGFKEYILDSSVYIKVFKMHDFLIIAVSFTKNTFTNKKFT